MLLPPPAVTSLAAALVPSENESESIMSATVQGIKSTYVASSRFRSAPGVARSLLVQAVVEVVDGVEPQSETEREEWTNEGRLGE